MGSGYVIEHCISAFSDNAKEDAYRFYAADCLRMLTEAVASIRGGPYMSKRFSDLVNKGPVDNRDGDQIAADVIRNAGLTFGGISA